MTGYEVIVGNVGSVYEGSDPKEANEIYDHYIEYRDVVGARCHGEAVVLMVNGEPEKEVFSIWENDEE